MYLRKERESIHGQFRPKERKGEREREVLTCKWDEEIRFDNLWISCIVFKSPQFAIFVQVWNDLPSTVESQFLTTLTLLQVQAKVVLALHEGFSSLQFLEELGHRGM